MTTLTNPELRRLTLVQGGGLEDNPQGDYVRFDQIEAILTDLIAERDEADRRAGAAERQMESKTESLAARNHWLDKAKAERGYHRNTSFDRVWKDTCKKADEVVGLRMLLERANSFITSGIDAGAIRMPDPSTPDKALETAELIAEAVASWTGKTYTRPDVTYSLTTLPAVPWTVVSEALALIETLNPIMGTGGKYYDGRDLITMYASGVMSTKEKTDSCREEIATLKANKA